MKEIYETPVATVVVLDQEDVLTASVDDDWSLPY